jgi:hypothetical protein
VGCWAKAEDIAMTTATDPPRIQPAEMFMHSPIATFF